jgi:hypothetical protein
VAEQCDQNDDGKGDAEQQKYNRAHLKLLNQSECISEIIDERACTSRGLRALPTKPLQHDPAVFLRLSRRSSRKTRQTRGR